MSPFSTMCRLVLTAACVAADSLRPNVLLVPADDLGYSDLGCHGGAIPTPNLDRLAQSGACFKKTYPSARCSPTRASLITGLHSHEARIGDFVSAKPSPKRGSACTGHLPDDNITIPEPRKLSGQGTWMVRKWQLGPPGRGRYRRALNPVHPLIGPSQRRHIIRTIPTRYRHNRMLESFSMEETAKVPGLNKVHFRTLVLSDLHLGTKDAQARELLDVLRGIRCDKLILNGDIIDLWSLQRKNHWSPAHTAVIRRIMKMAEKDGTKVIYLRGNHDDFIRRLIPLVLDRIELAEEHIHVAMDGRRYLCIHGDAFDTITVKMRWLAVVGDISYQILLDLNRFYNRWRAWRGKEYFSLSQAIKAKVKTAVSFISSFEEHLQTLAARRGCEGVMCGHIHKAEDRMIGTVRYINSGDWVESLTAVVEEDDGVIRVVERVELLRRIAERRAAFEAAQAAPAAPAVKAAAATIAFVA